MKRSISLAAAAMMLSVVAAFAAGKKMVGGAPMYPSKTIVENASQSKDHTTLVAAVKQAGLVDTLSGKGPFTVFAPTNEAFAALPKGTVETLMMPENKAKLTKILTYHVVPGKLEDKDLMAAIKKGDGTATFKTVEGDPLTFRHAAGGITVADVSGHMANITIPDVEQSNGVVHVIDKVLLPK